MISRKELFAEISNEAVTEDGEVVGYFVKNSRMNLLEQMLCGPVTVNLASRRLPSDYVDGEFGNDDLAAIHNACRLECKVSVEKNLSAYGIAVKWEAE